MAIEKTIFTVNYSSNPTGAAEEVANWLEANAADLFDTISVGDTSPNVDHVLCNIDDVDVLNYFQGNSSTAAGGTVSLKNETLKTLASASNLKQAYKTSKGILLNSSPAYNDGYAYTEPSTQEQVYNYYRRANIFVFKSNVGNTSIIMRCGTSSTGGMNYIMADLTADSKWSMFNYVNSQSVTGLSSIESIAVSKRPLTVLCPVPLGDGGTVADGVFFTPFSQYKGIDAPVTLTINGKNYIYDGFFALEE
jgi:hypothetical protein